MSLLNKLIEGPFVVFLRDNTGTEKMDILEPSLDLTVPLTKDGFINSEGLAVKFDG